MPHSCRSRQRPGAGLGPGSFDASFIELFDDDIAQLDEILDVSADR